jgi:hypothetical protein
VEVKNLKMEHVIFLIQMTVSFTEVVRLEIVEKEIVLHLLHAQVASQDFILKMEGQMVIAEVIFFYLKMCKTNI